jgi:hypothetical protein
VVVAANQAGNQNYLAAAQVTQTISVVKALPAVTLAGSPNAVFLLAPVTLTATVSSSISTPTGSVIFSDGSSVLGSAPLTAGVASITVSTLPVGANAIIAAYGGDGSYNPASSSAANVNVQDFTLSITGSTTETIQYGGTANYALTVTSINGATIPSAIGFAVAGAPAGSTITFAPANLAAGSPTSNLTLAIQVPEIIIATKDHRGGIRGARTLAALALCGLILPLRRRMRLRGKVAGRLGCVLLVVTAAIASGALTGCGGNVTYPLIQSFSITVTASSGALSHAASAGLVVQ